MGLIAVQLINRLMHGPLGENPWEDLKKHNAIRDHAAEVAAQKKIRVQEAKHAAEVAHQRAFEIKKARIQSGQDAPWVWRTAKNIVGAGVLVFGISGLVQWSSASGTLQGAAHVLATQAMAGMRGTPVPASGATIVADDSTLWRAFCQALAGAQAKCSPPTMPDYPVQLLGDQGGQPKVLGQKSVGGMTIGIGTDNAGRTVFSASMPVQIHPLGIHLVTVPATAEVTIPWGASGGGLF